MGSTKINRSRRDGGFTLVEMIVATVLLAIGVVASLLSYAAAARLSASAINRTTATFLAQQQLTSLQDDPNGLSTGNQNGDFGPQYPGFTWQSEIDASEFPSLDQVRLVVQWQSGLLTHSVELDTYLPATQPGSTTSAGTPSTTSGNRNGPRTP